MVRNAPLSPFRTGIPFFFILPSLCTKAQKEGKAQEKDKHLPSLAKKIDVCYASTSHFNVPSKIACLLLNWTELQTIYFKSLLQSLVLTHYFKPFVNLTVTMYILSNVQINVKIFRESGNATCII